ncbi:MAG TPA: hypothetical protein VFF79_03665 [Conexibacter sp.]|jgi:hypothetical protein|nr:hypothetical protein [Conexibacter sp.]
MTASTRCTVLIALVLLSAVAGARPAPAVAPSAGAIATVPQLTAEPVAVRPGDALTLTGSGFPRNVHIALFAGPSDGRTTRIGGARTGRRGSFNATIHIRPGSAAGRFVAFACHDGCRVRASVRFRIAR